MPKSIYEMGCTLAVKEIGAGHGIYTDESVYPCYTLTAFVCASDPDPARVDAIWPSRRLLAAETQHHSQIAQLRTIRVKNIFVGNLDFNASADELRQLFTAYGVVDQVNIVTDRDTGQPRGFGFVEMASAEDGNKAIAALNGTQLRDRTLNVNEARPRPERSGGSRGGRERRRSGERW